MRLVGATIVGLSQRVACTTTPGVDVESRSASAPTAAAPPSSVPASTTTLAPERDDILAPGPESVLFDLTNFNIEVTLPPTLAPTPPGGYDGFHTVVRVDDESLMATGFASPGDGILPERSALWLTFDGENWEPIGMRDISSQPDQHTINSLIVADGSVRAYGNLLDTTGPTERSVAIGHWTSANAGESWVGIPTAQSATARRAILVDDFIVTAGAGDVNERASFFGLVTVEVSGQPIRSEAIDVDTAGSPYPAGTRLTCSCCPTNGSWSVQPHSPTLAAAVTSPSSTAESSGFRRTSHCGHRSTRAIRGNTSTSPSSPARRELRPPRRS